MYRASSFFLLIAVMIVVVMLHGPAEAFWGFGSGHEEGANGLDLAQGYDRNTVTTLTGRIAVIPDPEADPVSVEIISGKDKYVVVLGPRWYLQDDNLDWKVGDTVSVRGSKAQGKDGRIYLLAQWFNSSLGGKLVLRNQAGRPSWTGGSRGIATQQSGGQGQRSGTGSGSGGRHGR